MWISVAEKSVRENSACNEKRKHRNRCRTRKKSRHIIVGSAESTWLDAWSRWHCSQPFMETFRRLPLSLTHTTARGTYTMTAMWLRGGNTIKISIHSHNAGTPILARIGTFPLRTHTPAQRPDWLCRGAVRVALQCGGLSYSVLSSSLLVLIWLYNQIITADFNALVFHVRANRSGRMMMTTAAAEVTTMTMAHMRYPTKAVC